MQVFQSTSLITFWIIFFSIVYTILVCVCGLFQIQTYVHASTLYIQIVFLTFPIKGDNFWVSGILSVMQVKYLPVHRLHFLSDSNNSFCLELVELLEQVSDVTPELKVQIQLHNVLHVCSEKKRKQKKKKNRKKKEK